MILVLLACADSVQSKKNNEKNASCALQGRNFTKRWYTVYFFSNYLFNPNLDGPFRG